jgi:hypothetical protein
MIDLATGYGFIIDPFAEFALRVYEDYDGDEHYPHESLTELADEALRWLNYGDNEGVDRTWKGQNSPPVIPAGMSWQWNDGDFGLYWAETDGECAICGADGTHLTDEERANIEFTTGEPWWARNCSH